MAAGDLELLALAAACVLGMVVLIAWLRLSAFLSLIIASAALGFAAHMDGLAVVAALQKGFGDIVGSVGLVLVLGTILGALIAGAGGADRIALLVANAKSPMGVAWGMLFVSLLVGLPMFFEAGLGILMPIMLRIAQKLDLKENGDRYLLVAMPVLSGLSVAHGLLPPHPGPLAAAAALHADVGLVLLLGIVVAIPAAAIGGPFYTKLMWNKAKTQPNLALAGVLTEFKDLPPLGVTLFVLFLPVVLIAAGSLANVVAPDAPSTHVLAILGAPAVALLIAVAAAFLLLGVARRRSLTDMGVDIGRGTAAIAIILVIIGAGGALKEILIQSGVSSAIGRMASSMHMSALLLGWIAAALMRVSVGSATVATVTAAGLVAPLALALSPIDRALTVLSIGAGSVIFSHINNSGFWMVREYLGMSIGDTFKTWSSIETIVSIVSLIVILIMSVALAGVALA
ncbi:MAG: gluconate:H+ symporter [Pseudomonadota bacterium]